MTSFNQKRFISIESTANSFQPKRQHSGKTYFTRNFHISCYIGLVLILYIAMMVGLSVPAAPFWVVLFETVLATDVIVENKFSRPLPTKVKCLNWISAGLIAILGTVVITWGVVLGDILTTLGGEGSQFGLFVGLSLSAGLGILLSAFLHICSAILVGGSTQRISRTASSFRPAQSRPGQTRLAQSRTARYNIQQYRSQDRSPNSSLARWMNFHIWSILRKMARGLGLSLLIVFGSIAAGAQGMAVAIIWAIAFTTVISSANRYFPKYFSQ
ncbi:MAG: hypothetical protein AAGC93_19130 [Cyanobacteria bacterium P01_F01_bin.53]